MPGSAPGPESAPPGESYPRWSSRLSSWGSHHGAHCPPGLRELPHTAVRPEDPRNRGSARCWETPRPHGRERGPDSIAASETGSGRFSRALGHHALKRARSPTDKTSANRSDRTPRFRSQDVLRPRPTRLVWPWLLHVGSDFPAARLGGRGHDNRGH